MSSWWTIGVLGILIAVYVAAAYLPIGGRYVWQWRMFDTTRHAILTWWPLLIAAWLLAAVIVWSAMRRLPWRIDNLGAFVAVLGLAIILISQSWAFRSQSIGVAAVPITKPTAGDQIDVFSLPPPLTTYGDTHDRVLVIMARGSAPIAIPLDELPRWNDASGDAMPTLALHDNSKLAPVIGYSTRITTKAYLAEGTLHETEDGAQAAKPTPDDERDLTALPYPANALLALEITTDLDEGGTSSTTIWLPFEPEATDALAPKRFFPVKGLGSVGLSFRPASKRLQFALWLQADASRDVGWIFASDRDADGRLLEPKKFSLLETLNEPAQYRAATEDNRVEVFDIQWTNMPDRLAASHYGIEIRSRASNLFILAGLITFVFGVILDRVASWLPRKRRTASPGP